MSGTIKVLLLAADPDRGTEGLRIDHEIRAAMEAARAGGAPTALKIRAELAVCRDDLLPLLLRHRPHVVQFAAHGSGGRHVVMDDGSRVGAGDLGPLLSSVGGVRVVVLNACNLLELGQALSGVVDYVVAVEQPVRDVAAIHFTGAFYAALAWGRTVPAAFDVARTSTAGRFGVAAGIPRLLARPGAGEQPLVGETAAPAAAAPSVLRNDVEELEAEADIEVTHDVRGRAGERPVHANNHVRNAKSGGSIRIGSTLR